MAGIIPITVDKKDRAFDIYSRLLQDRIIFVSGFFNEDLANMVVAQLLLLESENPELDIAMYINSPGGEINAAFAIYDTMQYIKADIQTVAFGLAASAASLILAAGTKGKRVSLPNTRILLHQGFSGAEGQITDLMITVKELSKLQDRLFSIYSNLTGQPKDRISKDLNRDFWMTPEDALEYGIIDKILTFKEE